MCLRCGLCGRGIPVWVSKRSRAMAELGDGVPPCPGELGGGVRDGRCTLTCHLASFSISSPRHGGTSQSEFHRSAQSVAAPPPSHTIIVEEVASMPAAPCCSAQGSWASSRASNDSSAARPTPRLMPHHTLARVTSMHAHTPYAAFDAPPHARPPPRCRVISKAAKRLC